MSDESDTVQTSFLIERHVKEAAKEKTDHGELSELCRNLYRQIAFGEDVAEYSQVEIELERERERRDEIDREIRELEAERTSVDQYIARLEERQSKATSRNDKFEAKLEEIEFEQLYEGVPAVPDVPSIERAARVIGESPEYVVEELRERNPHLPPAAFRDQFTEGVKWCGLDENDQPITEEGHR